MKTTRYVAQDVLFDMVRWPWWWYTTGVVLAGKRFLEMVRDANNQFGVMVWIKNILVPMYGDYAWSGRLVSFFMRVVQVIGRSLLLLLWTLFAGFIFLLWLIIPLFIVYNIALNWPAISSL